MPGLAVTDAIGEWWVYPVATQIAPDKSVFGAISSTGEVLACEMEHTRMTSKRVVVGMIQVDDHNVPALHASNPGRRMLMAWTRHGVDNVIRFKVSDTAQTVESLATAPLVNYECPETVSYAQIYRVDALSDGVQDTFWVFSRVTLATWRCLVVSVNQTTGALTFGPITTLLTADGQTYIHAAESHGGVLRVAWSFNPAAPYHAIRYFEIDMSTGAITSPVVPTLAANLNTGIGLPLHDTAVPPVIPEPAAGDSRIMFYTRPGPYKRGIAYADYSNADPDNATYKITTIEDGGVTSTRAYGISGPRFGYVASSNYLPGMAFPDPCEVDEVVIARKTGAVSTVERAMWDGTNVVTTMLGQSYASRLARPMLPVGQSTRVLCSDIIWYNPTSFFDYHAGVRDVTSTDDHVHAPTGFTQVIGGVSTPTHFA